MNNSAQNLPAVENASDASDIRAQETSQFVTFYFGRHFFGLPIDEVIEINKALDITPVPLAPGYVSGVINLRGQILTAINLSQRIGLDSTQEDVQTDRLNNVIMGNREEPISLLVEKIGDVMSIPTERIESVPDMIHGIDTRYVSQVCKLDDKLLIILNSNAIEELTEKNRAN
ncbi:MAG: chemotaxis protein CheW [Thermodesulfatator sp.]|nr:MAG: chemotaxis protein CheW [Thermodesulfatator sp.]